MAPPDCSLRLATPPSITMADPGEGKPQVPDDEGQAAGGFVSAWPYLREEPWDAT